MNDMVEMRQGIPALAMDESELIDVLESSLYPGAKLPTIKMVVGYCRASSLDPMQKPVHIVPMSVSTGEKDANGWDIKKMRDVIMPGIGLYRTQAARTGQYAGVSEPEFGPTKLLKFEEVVWEEVPGQKNKSKKTYNREMEYPEWCKITVQKFVNGEIRDFVAKEYWTENYATKGANSDAPNAMWKRRPFAQIAKCAEAQALRKAFPDSTGAAPTADEMEGKHLLDDDSVIDGDATGAIKPEVSMPKAKTAPVAQKPVFCTDEKFKTNRTAWENIVTSGRKTAAELIIFLEAKAPLTDAQKEEIGKWKKKPDESVSDTDDFVKALDKSGDYTPE
jgi:phage recombination protein Bet